MLDFLIRLRHDLHVKLFFLFVGLICFKNGLLLLLLLLLLLYYYYHYYYYYYYFFFSLILIRKRFFYIIFTEIDYIDFNIKVLQNMKHIKLLAPDILTNTIDI